MELKKQMCWNVCGEEKKAPCTAPWSLCETYFEEAVESSENYIGWQIRTTRHCASML